MDLFSPYRTIKRNLLPTSRKMFSMLRTFFSTGESENGFFALYGSIKFTLWRTSSKMFVRVAYNFLSTKGSKDGFVHPVYGNKIHFIGR